MITGSRRSEGRGGVEGGGRRGVFLLALLKLVDGHRQIRVIVANVVSEHALGGGEEKA